MAIEKEININVNVGNSTSKIDKLNKGFSTLKTNTKEVTSSLGDSSNAILENGGAMGLLNDATGGVAMTIKDAVEATWLFTKGTTFATATQKIYTLVVGTTTGALKALRIALVSTGLGAIVVALGFLIAKMNEATEATEAQTRAQDALNKSLDATNNLYKDEIKALEDVTKERLLRAKIAGKSEADLMKIEKESEDERYQNYINERERLLQQLSDKNLNADGQEKVNKALAENQREYFSFVQGQRNKDLEDELSNKEKRDKLTADAIEKAKKDAEEARKRREEENKKFLEEFEAFKQKIRDSETADLDRKIKAEIEAEQILKGLRVQTELDKIKEAEQRDLLVLEQANATQEQLFEVQAYYAEKRNELLDKELSEADAKKKASADKEKALNQAVADAKVAITQNGIALVQQLVKEDSEIGKGLALAQATISGIEGVQNAYTTAQKSPITIGFPAYPAVQAGLAGAFSLLQIKKILSVDASGESGTSASTSSSGGGASAPSFNLVQGTGSNQIAEGLTSQRQPLQAYVVASNVTSAQALDRNIINDASI